MTCARAAAPGRVRCEVEARAKAGESIAWGDVTLIKTPSFASGLRGRVHTCRDTKLIITYHPAYLLRDPRQKKEAWQDLKLAMAELGLSVPSR